MESLKAASRMELPFDADDAILTERAVRVAKDVCIFAFFVAICQVGHARSTASSILDFLVSLRKKSTEAEPELRENPVRLRRLLLQTCQYP